MSSLSLRLRIFLFFCLLALGGIGLNLGALWLGYRQLADPSALSSFLTSAIISAFGFLGMAVFIWLLFDENVSKPIERLAAKLRVNAHSDLVDEFDEDSAKYLGDLGPAARALQDRLKTTAQDTSETLAQQTDRLKNQRKQLLRILSDIPIAVIVAKADHQIVLYDGQAADILETEAPARLNGSIADYLKVDLIKAALEQMAQDGVKRMPFTAQGHSGVAYSGHIRVFDAGAGYTLMLETVPSDAPRPLVYDFDLLDKTVPANVAETPLADLGFVVFDSETTGLDPNKDKVVQLGAIRVVNGKVVYGETFDTLVNPTCKIPPHSTKVHGISDEMVQGAPDFATASARFHCFCEGSVLIAHNAPFDMAFLKNVGQPCFDHPVLDTVHLSAIVFGGSQEHTLDALCTRLNIEIPAEHRHTALGDAIATAQVFVALLPVLKARGLDSFARIKAEMHKHSRILKVQE